MPVPYNVRVPEPIPPIHRRPAHPRAARPARSHVQATSREINGTLRPRRAHTRRMAGMVVCVVAVLGLWLGAVMTRLGQAVDTLAMLRLRELSSIDPIDISFTHTVISYGGLAAIVIAVALIAIVRKRWQLAIRAVIVLAGANLTTQLLKTYLLPRPDLGINWATPPSLPSGHTTVAAATAVALIMVVPVAWRTVSVLIGTGWTLFIGFTTLVNGWHRPSDVLAAILVAAAWGFALAPNEVGPIAAARLRLVILRMAMAAAVIGGMGITAVAIRVASAGFLDAERLSGRVLTTAAGHGLTGAIAAASAALILTGVCALAFRQIDLIRTEAGGAR